MKKFQATINFLLADSGRQFDEGEIVEMSEKEAKKINQLAKAAFPEKENVLKRVEEIEVEDTSAS
ncbi:hypothetical protein MMJ00_08165 [Enterococcus cecorum]|uniref:hypothetical protein n=1 Tax=Enterococcus cecorum TaxID=44008 RepID=UPI001FADF67D|nr:hypothetical protein [Enterococcus cecorum]MCJ0567030.1 hypothetical protein [Enterococcus cecorum]MCJ0597904.1 hypothetical protein [Enterococcus cecorum]MCJ0603990.1 hypothetical protein [Enterococcus cecorum]